MRATPGSQNDLFSSEAVEAFFAAEYEVTAQSDRMGVRLAGTKIAHLGDGNIISDGVSAGAIQVPGDGVPIVTLADAQTTGGYPKIAWVAATDLPVAAQLRPGERVRFASIPVDGAQALYFARLEEYADLRRRLDALSARARDYDVKVGGANFRVSVAPAEGS